VRYIFATTVLAGLAVMLANVPPLSGAAESSPPKTAPAEGTGSAGVGATKDASPAEGATNDAPAAGTAGKGAAAALPAPAAKPPASESPSDEDVEKIVVTASRIREPGFGTPYAVNVVAADQIRDESYRTSTDALRDIPGIMPQKTSLGQGSPYIRGFTGYHNLYLVDGIRLNNSVFRSGPNQYWNTVDPLSVSRYEVVKGPGSIMYGSGAVGGMVNAISRGPEGYGDGFQSGGRLSYRLSSAERSETGHMEAYATWDHTLGLFVGGSIKDFGDLQGGRDVGRQRDTGYDEWDGNFKAEYFINPNTRIVVGHQHVRQDDVPRTHQTVFGTTWDGLTKGTDLRQDLTQTRDLTYVQFHAENLKGWIDALHLTLSWQEQDETRDRLRTKHRFDQQGFSVGTLGTSLVLESPSPVGRWVYGFDFYRDNVNSFSTANPIQGPVADDANYSQFGAFVQDTIPFTDRFNLTLGARYEHDQARADKVSDPATGRRFEIARDWDSVVGSSRAVYFLDEKKHWNVYGGVSQAFRAPNLSDLTRFDIARTNEIETPAPNLEPERFLSYEIGAKADYKDFTLQASYFYTVIDDLIVRHPTGLKIGGLNEAAKENAGQGFVQGIEIAPSWRFHPQFTLFGALTWQEGEVVDFPTAAPQKRREPLSRVMPTTTRVGLRWDDPNGKLWAEVTGIFAARQDRLSADDISDTSRIPPGGTPGYEVLALRGGYRVTRNVDLTWAIENVTNEDYRIHGSGINEPGRNFIFGIEMRF
jgi:hemoglobin/transferrin/lactoferrin receptor protein